MKDISRQIREMRRKRGLSLQRAALRIDTSAATLSRYENGWKRFEIYTLKKIATALGYNLKISFEPIRRAGDSCGPVRKSADPDAVIAQLKRLFWDVPLRTEHLEEYPAWVVERVLEYGTLRDVQILLQFLEREKFLDIVSRINFKSTRTRIFWRQILKKENRPCTKKFFRQEAVKSWPS